MKPTENQQKLAELVKGQAEFWIETNDISSPTHLCDLEQDIDEIEFLSEDEKSKFCDMLLGILNFIRNH